MVALPNPSFEPKTHRWRPGAVAPNREVPSQICAVLGQKQPFFAQNSPSKGSKQPNEGKRLLHSTCGLTFSRPRDLWCPLTPRYVRETAHKGAKKPPKFAQCAPAPRNQARTVCWATWLKNEFRGHLVHPASPRTVGANGGSTRVPRAKKMIFSKVVPRPLGMLKQVFLGHFEPVVARFGPWKIPKCLENGPFWDQQWVKNGSKTRFPKKDPWTIMMLKQVVLAHFKPVGTGFGSWKLPKCLENGPFWDQKWVKNGSKTRISKSDRGPFGMLKQVFLARFDRV